MVWNMLGIIQTLRRAVMKKIRVPDNSPALTHYLNEGWVTLWKEGSWVVLTFPDNWE